MSRCGAYFITETSLLAEVATANHTKDFVNRSIRGQSAVENGELPLESGWDIIATSSGMDHGCHELQIHNVSEVPGFLQAVESFHLHQLTYNLISHLLDVVTEE